MHPRVFKFYGKAISHDGPVSVTATFNGIEIHSGPVSTASSVPLGSIHQSGDVLFEYTGTTELSGEIPFELSVSNGVVYFGLVKANYSGIEFDVDYADPENPVVVVDIAPENFWDEINQNTIESDGKLNVVINGIDCTSRSFDPPYNGDWWYTVPLNGTLTCNIVVDPKIIVTEAPGVEAAIAHLAKDFEPE